MFRAVIRFFRGIGYLFVGRLDGFTDQISSNPAAMRGSYGEIIREKKGRINDYMKAVGTLIAQQEKKSGQVKAITAEIQRLEKLKSGAAGRAKAVSSDLKAAGKSVEDIKKDATFVQCQSSFSDFSSTLAEKNARIIELESSLGEYADRISSHKIQLTSLRREIENLSSESADAVADVISAQEEKEINSVLAGISEDGTAAELERLRNIRGQAKAEAEIASELAGTDHKRLEAEYETFATAHESNDEFDALIGLDESADAKLERVTEKLQDLQEASEESLASVEAETV